MWTGRHIAAQQQQPILQNLMVRVDRLENEKKQQSTAIRSGNNQRISVTNNIELQ